VGTLAVGGVLTSNKGNVRGRGSKSAGSRNSSGDEGGERNHFQGCWVNERMGGCMKRMVIVGDGDLLGSRVVMAL
jgi:hypothetical protein